MLEVRLITTKIAIKSLRNSNVKQVALHSHPPLFKIALRLCYELEVGWRAWKDVSIRTFAAMDIEV
jgi:hypothetical protein